MSRGDLSKQMQDGYKEDPLELFPTLRKLLIEIINELTQDKGNVERPIIALLENSNVSEEVFNLAEKQLKNSGIYTLTQSNLEEAKSILKGENLDNDSGKLQYSISSILKSYIGADILGRPISIHRGFYSKKNKQNKFVFLTDKTTMYLEEIKFSRISKFFNDSGLQTKMFFTSGISKDGIYFNRITDGYIISRPEEIKTISDLYTFEYQKYKGKVEFGENGEIVYDEESFIGKSQIIYMSEVGKNPCFIPPIEKDKTGKIRNYLLSAPKRNDIEKRFSRDYDRFPHFRNIGEVQRLKQRNRN